MSAIELPDLLTVDEAAARLRVSANTIYRAAKDGRLEVSRLGGGPRARIRIPDAELARFLRRFSAGGQDAGQPRRPKREGR